jgi:hypothetical protein
MAASVFDSDCAAAANNYRTGIAVFTIASGGFGTATYIVGQKFSYLPVASSLLGLSDLHDGYAVCIQGWDHEVDHSALHRMSE